MESRLPLASKCRSSSSSITPEALPRPPEVTAGIIQFTRPGVVSNRRGPRFRPLLPGPPEPRPPLRRSVLRGRHHHRHLLPADLPLPAAAPAQRALLRLRGGGPGGGLPSVFALPAG